MENMKFKDALEFVQSFALTSYSCTKLLAILDADNTLLEGELLEEAQKASMFIRGYKLRNAKGGDKVKIFFTLSLRNKSVLNFALP